MDALRIALLAQLCQARPLRLLDGRIDFQAFELDLLLHLEGVDADDDFVAAADGKLVLVSGFLDFVLDIAALDGGQGPTEVVDSLDVLEGTPLDLVGKVFDQV